MVKKVKRPLHQPGFFTRSGELTIRSEGEESKRFQLSFSSETPYLRYGEEEILLHTPEAVDLTRLRTAGALLYEHGRDFMGRFPIGRIEEVRLDTAAALPTSPLTRRTSLPLPSAGRWKLE